MRKALYCLVRNGMLYVLTSVWVLTRRWWVARTNARYDGPCRRRSRQRSGRSAPSSHRQQHVRDRALAAAVPAGITWIYPVIIDDRALATAPPASWPARARDEHNVPDALRQAADQGLETEIDIDNASYFLSRITIVRGDAPGMSTWRKKLFLAMANTATNPVDIFCLPEHRIVTVGSYTDI